MQESFEEAEFSDPAKKPPFWWGSAEQLMTTLHPNHPAFSQFFEVMQRTGFTILPAFSTQENVTDVVALIQRYPFMDQKQPHDILSIAKGYQTGLALPQLVVYWKKQLVGYVCLKTIQLAQSPEAYLYEKTLVTDIQTGWGKEARTTFIQQVVPQLSTQSNETFMPQTLGQALSDGIVLFNEALVQHPLATISWVTTRLHQKATSPVLGYQVNAKNISLPAALFAQRYPGILQKMYPQYQGNIIIADTDEIQSRIVYNTTTENLLEPYKQ